MAYGTPSELTFARLPNTIVNTIMKNTGCMTAHPIPRADCAGDVIRLERSQLDALPRGDGSSDGLAGGIITIDGGGVAINRSEVLADGQENANGGKVFISANPLLLSTDSVISASSEVGIEGLVVIDAPDAEVTSDLASLPENFLDASALLEEACLARNAPSGSFAVHSVGALPRSPDAPLRARSEELKAVVGCPP